MASAADLREAANARTRDVISAILEDHADIQDFLNAVAEASTHDERKLAWTAARNRLVVHESSEQDVTRPLVAEAAPDVADARTAEERALEERVRRLDDLDLDDERFRTEFETLHADVLVHFRAEENEEHPVLERAVAPGRRRTLRNVFGAAGDAEPTRAEHAPGAAGHDPAHGVLDRLRDLLGLGRRR